MNVIQGFECLLATTAYMSIGSAFGSFTRPLVDDVWGREWVALCTVAWPIIMPITISTRFGASAAATFGEWKSAREHRNRCHAAHQRATDEAELLALKVAEDEISCGRAWESGSFKETIIRRYNGRPS